MDRPRVVICTSASVDGRVTLAPDVLLLYGDERWQAVAGSSDMFDWLKFTHKPQATLEGSGSFVLAGTEPEPLPAVEGDRDLLYKDFLPDAVIQRPGHQGWFTAVDGRGRIRWAYKEWPDEAWAGWHLLVLAAHRTPPEYLAYLRREDIPYLIAGDERVDLRRALEKMGDRLGVECVISTAGGRLNGALLRAGLVDEINVELFPAIIGGRETPSLFDAPALQPNEWPTRLEMISTRVQDDGNVWLRYRVVQE